MLGSAGAPATAAQMDWPQLRQRQLSAAYFVLALLIPLALLTILARNGLPQYWGLMAVSASVAAIALSLPFHLARFVDTEQSRVLWHGTLVILCGLAALALTYLGSTGTMILVAVAGVSVGVLLRNLSWVRGKAWWLLLLFATLYLAFEIGGNKYANFFSDRLALFGRTDGDIFAHGAIIGSILSFGWPSFAIDGLEPLHYHVAVFWISARLNEAGGGDTIAAEVMTKIFLLIPLLLFAVTQAATLFNAALSRGQPAGATRLVTWLGMVIFVVPVAGLGFATLNSGTMSLGAALALLTFPALYFLGTDTDASVRTRHLAWAGAAIALFPIAAAKISMAFVLSCIFGWWILRIEGPKRLTFWLWGGLGFLAFLGAYLLFNDSGSMGSQLFGKPYYVEYGFERGRWWIPITYQIETIVAFVLVRLFVYAGSARRITLETLVIAAIAGNVPGLILYIQSGNAAYFLVSQAWIAIPILAAVLPLFAQAVFNRLAGWRHWAPAAIIIVLVVGLGYASFSELRVRASLFIDANALLRSGDLSYYADDSRRVWREDAKRAVKEFGLWDVLTRPAATPTGEKLALDLRELRATLGPKAALYITTGNTEYWNLVIDCDGRSVFPVAMAGLALTDGYVPSQAECEQEIALRGFGKPPAVREELSQDQACQRAVGQGFEKLIWLDTMDAKAAAVVTCN